MKVKPLEAVLDDMVGSSWRRREPIEKTLLINGALNMAKAFYVETNTGLQNLGKLEAGNYTCLERVFFHGVEFSAAGFLTRFHIESEDDDIFLKVYGPQKYVPLPRVRLQFSKENFMILYPPLK